MNAFCYQDGEISISDCIVKWTIEDIFSFPQKPNVVIISPKFQFAEIKWRLRVFPWGRKVPRYEDTSGWLGIALCATGPPDILNNKSFNIHFRIAGMTEEVQSSSPDRRNLWYVTDKLLKSNKLKSQRDEIAPENVLTILCEIETEKLSKSETLSDFKYAILKLRPNNFVDGEEISELSKADEILYESVSISAEAVCGSSTQISEDVESSNPSKTQNCDGNGNADDLYADTDTESSYCSVSSADTEANRNCSEVEHAKEKYVETSNVQDQLSALPKGVARALQDYKELLLREIHSDITIKVGNKQFKAHRNILAARTPVFAAMLKHNMREKATGVVTIEDMDPKAFPDFLEYLYTGQVQSLSSGNVLELFTAADKYQVKELREECFEYMKENMSVDNFCGILSLSLRHQLKELIVLATQFFIVNAVDIVKTSKWQIFVLENAVAANELFIKQLEFHNGNHK